MLAIERADAGRSVQFVAGNDIKIAIDVADVDIQMNGGLCAVDERRNSPRMRDPNDFLDRHHGAKHVRHLRDRDHLGAVGQQLLEFVDQEIAVVIHRRPFDDRALAFPQKMPWNDVGVVLHDGEHDFVAGPDPLAPESLGNEVDRFGGAPREDNLIATLGVQEAGHLFTGPLVAFGRGIGEIMQPAVNV